LFLKLKSQNRYNALVERYEKAKERYEELNAIKEERLRKSRVIKRCLQDLSEIEEGITEFNDYLRLTIVHSVVVKSECTSVFCFFSGIEIEG